MVGQEKVAMREGVVVMLLLPLPSACPSATLPASTFPF